MTIRKTVTLPAVCKREILRYAGCREADPAVLQLLDACLAEAEPILRGAVCYLLLSVAVEGKRCDFGAFSLTSASLADRLRGCDRVLVLAATVGIGLDRLIARYGSPSPAKAVLLQAIGAERIEALVDAFLTEFSAEQGTPLRRRFSPGYGDLPLSAQRELFAVLDAAKHIGLSLTDSLLMTPSKSVTALVGLGDDPTPPRHRCEACELKTCAFRGAV